MTDVRKASCACGAVRLEVRGDLPPPDACHCTTCRKTSGHYLVSTDVPRDAVTVTGEENVTWYQSSDKVRRGFCATCGSTIFFDPIDTKKHNWTSVALGAFDSPTDTHIKIHIFVASKGDYYELNDGVPQNQQ